MFGLFAWFPILRAFVMSVQETNLVSAPTFVGLDNFGRVLADPQFGTAVSNTAWFALLALLFGFPVPIILGVLMSEVRRFRGLYSALAYLPVVIPPVVAVLLWRFFYDASPHGVFNTILGWVGIGPLPWLQDSGSAMPAIVIEATWAAAGATVIIYLAALLGVAPELYDAAEVDGASIWQKIRYITLPSIRTILFVTLILQLIATAQIFTEPLLFTGGGPTNATLTVLLLDLPLRVPEQPGRRLRDGRRAEPHAGRLPGRLHRRLLLADPVVERRVVMRPAAATPDARPARRRPRAGSWAGRTGASAGRAGRCASCTSRSSSSCWSPASARSCGC